MIIKNGLVFNTVMKKFYRSDVKIENGKITDIGVLDGDEVIDADGKYVVPGFVDIHSHGAIGVDTMDKDSDSIERMCEFYSSHGVTTLFPTTTTAKHEDTKKAVIAVNSVDKDKCPVSLRGIHIEGPYLDVKRAGAHPHDLLKAPDIEELKEYVALNGDNVVYMTVAPELDGAIDFIKEASKLGVKVSIGHSETDSETVKRALGAGAVSFTHTFNAMTPIHHREPGVVGVALMSDAYAEFICDGEHLHPDIVALSYKVKTSDRFILVTDSMQAAGMPDGEYMLGELMTYVVDGVARIKEGNLAGSTANLHNCMLNLMKFAGASLEDALLCATRNPALVSGIYDKVGSVDVGKDADILILDSDLSIDKTISRGRIVYSK